MLYFIFRMPYSVEPAGMFLPQLERESGCILVSCCPCVEQDKKVHYNLKKLEICWFRVVHARSTERDLIFPLQIEEETACILVFACPCVEHDQIFPLQFEEVGNMLVSDCPFIQSRVPYYCAFQQ